MTHDLSRLLRPKSIAVIGGGAWCRAVIKQLKKSAYDGHIWPVHPSKTNIEGLDTFANIDALPSAPDAAFVGINRDATIDSITALSARNAGGAVCFASGFSEVDDGHNLNSALLKAAGNMPILGPNCYGMINALDGALIWPDQHGCDPVDKGVAILTQSSNIAINLTMQMRGLPIAYVVTCGNQAQTSQTDIAMALLDDPRVTAIGFHIEGMGDIAGWQTLARKAKAQNIPLVALKSGRSDAAQLAAVSHTASMAGKDAAAQALLTRFGIARVMDLPSFLETLKLLHMCGPLPSIEIASISCSGGEAALIADMAIGTKIRFPDLTNPQKKGLLQALGPKVALANPLDYHTYIWGDTDAMTATFSAMAESDHALTLLIVDFPRGDKCDTSDWDCVIEAAISTAKTTGHKIGIVATLPELLPEDVARHLIDNNVIPFMGLAEALNAIEAATCRTFDDLTLDALPITQQGKGHTLTEAKAKVALSEFGLDVPNSVSFKGKLKTSLKFPLVLKGMGFAHKTENNAVRLNLTNMEEVAAAANTMPTDTFLLEEMVSNGVAELLIGITIDPVHGFLLTIGAGGTLTEVLNDTAHLIVPASEASIKQCLTRLKSAKILMGYRGKPAASIDSIVAAIVAIQNYVIANADAVIEIEVNPLICTPTSAIAADALIRTSL